MQNVTDTLPTAYVVDPKGRVRHIIYAPHLAGGIVECKEKRFRKPDGTKYKRWTCYLTPESQRSGHVFLQDVYASEKRLDHWQVWLDYHKADREKRLPGINKEWDPGDGRKMIARHNIPFDEKFLPEFVKKRKNNTGDTAISMFVFPDGIDKPELPQAVTADVTDMIEAVDDDKDD